MNKHTRRKHGRKFGCSICADKFETKGKLNIHQKAHSFKSKNADTLLETQTVTSLVKQ